MAFNDRMCYFLLMSFVCLIASQKYPTYSEDNVPHTSFSCKNMVDGGYYADIETDCQMYHVCYKDRHGIMRSNQFLCGNGTVFDQRHLVCTDYRKVLKCQESKNYYSTSASLFEHLEDRWRNEKTNKEILDSANFEFKRLH